MIVKIIYFSQTQNTRLIAEAIAQGIKDKGAEISLVNWMDIRHKPAEEVIDGCDLLGIGYPCFYYKAPFCIQDWLKKFPTVKDQPYFQFAPYGAALGPVFRRVDNILRKKGWVFLDSCAFLAFGSFQFLDPFPRCSVQYPDDLELAKARQFGQFQVLKGANFQLGRRNFLKRPERGEWFWYKRSYMMTKKKINKIFPPFTLNADKCTQCNHCVDNCPDSAIKLNQEGYPVFPQMCTRCYYCAKKCPTQAIENNWKPLWAKMAPVVLSTYPDWLVNRPDVSHLWEKHPNWKKLYPTL